MFLLRTKKEAPQYLAYWLRYACSHLGHPVKYLHIDGGELDAKAVRKVINSIERNGTGGTQLQITGTAQSQQNPTAERGIRTLHDVIIKSLP